MTPAQPRGRLPGADRGGSGNERLRLVAHQFRYDQKVFWRNPAAVFFTVAVPGRPAADLRHRSSATRRSTCAAGSRPPTYYVPAIITLAVISATMQTLAMSLVIAREDGRLKRGRGTPMPAWVFIAGRVGNSIVVSLLMLALVAALGQRPLRRRRSPGRELPELLVVLVGRRRRLLLPRHRADRGDPLAGRRRADRQRAAAAALLPLRRLHPRRRDARRRDRLRQPLPGPAFLPGVLRRLRARAAAPALAWDHLAVVAIWGVAGLLLAIRFFRWTPRGG